MVDRVIIDPHICHGKPIIRGTRIPVTVIIGLVAAGTSFAEIQREYDLEQDDIRAALEYAARLVDEEQHHPLPA